MFNCSKRLKREYVSEVDVFLSEFDVRDEATSLARKKEEEKHRRIAMLRDNQDTKEDTFNLWKDF